MDFIDKIRQFSARVQSMKDSITTEEATKTSMIMPFFQLLGYDVFNPMEFVPEFTADVGIKKGEKVDYAIMDSDGQPTILIEAKWCGESLDKHGSQLFRYFATTSAKFGILTNGLVYRFYTDLDESNKMDMQPFLEFDMLNLKENLIPEIKKFQKQTFDIDAIVSSASELKYSSQIRQLLTQQFVNPDDLFVKYVLSKVYSGMRTQKIVDSFRPIVKKSLSQFINELISERLKSALENEEQSSQASEPDMPEAVAESKIITTQEEIEGFFIIKSILYPVLDGHKLTYKDTVDYFGILLDNNSWKWICRLYVSGRKKRFITRDGTRYDIKTVSDLYQYKEQLEQAVRDCMSKEKG